MHFWANILILLLFSLSVKTVTKGAESADSVKGPSTYLSCAAGSGPLHTFISAESVHAHSAPHSYGAFLE